MFYSYACFTYLSMYTTGVTQNFPGQNGVANGESLGSAVLNEGTRAILVPRANCSDSHCAVYEAAEPLYILFDARFRNSPVCVYLWPLPPTFIRFIRFVWNGSASIGILISEIFISRYRTRPSNNIVSRPLFSFEIIYQKNTSGYRRIKK